MTLAEYDSDIKIKAFTQKSLCHWSFITRLFANNGLRDQVSVFRTIGPLVLLWNSTGLPYNCFMHIALRTHRILACIMLANIEKKAHL